MALDYTHFESKWRTKETALDHISYLQIDYASPSRNSTERTLLSSLCILLVSKRQSRMSPLYRVPTIHLYLLITI